MIEIKDNALFTLDELSRLLEISKYSLRKWIREGRLQGHKVGRGIRVWGSDLRKCVNSQGRGRRGGFAKTPNPQKRKKRAAAARR